MSKLSI